MEHVRDGRVDRVYTAGVLVVAALAFDVLDGRVARWRHVSSPLGRELDSLADVISFGVAPASLAYAIGMSTVCDALILLYFVACGISRLARYNVTAESLAADTGTVRYFEGTPIPTSTILVLLLVALAFCSFHPARPALRNLRLAHDQQDPANPEALSAASWRRRPRGVERPVDRGTYGSALWNVSWRIRLSPKVSGAPRSAATTAMSPFAWTTPA